jgi:RNA polymerase sigma-70 factor (ECF subfamily)
MGDRELTQWVRTRVRRIVAYRGYGIPHQDQDDLVQAAMTQVWEAVRRPEFDPRGLWAFVDTVASRRCIDWRRRQRPESTLDAVKSRQEPGEDALGSLLDSERTAIARHALSSLPEGCRELIELYVRDGLPYSAIALRLGRSEAALRVQMHRCVQRAADEVKRVLGQRSTSA